MVKTLYVVRSVVRAPLCAQPGLEAPCCSVLVAVFKSRYVLEEVFYPWCFSRGVSVAVFSLWSFICSELEHNLKNMLEHRLEHKLDHELDHDL